jgi:hypothetical protein
MDSTRHFPEIARTGVASYVDGKEKLAVELGARGGVPDAVADAVVCLLRRGAHASLERVPRDEIASALRRDVDAGFDRFPERHDAVVRALAAHDGWRLTLSADPRDALPLLQQMLDAP